MSPSSTPARVRNRHARPGGYATREPQKSDIYQLLLDNAETFLAHHEQLFQPEYGYLRPEVQSTLEELIACGDFRFGLARVKCRDCGDEMFIPLSCRRERLEGLLNYMARHPFNPRGIHYNADRGTVRYQAPRVHGTRKTDTIEVEAVDFIAMLAQHIPHRRRHQFRYYGAANPKVRKRLGLCGLPVDTEMPEVTAARGRKSWARLIWKLYGVDPLVCKKCSGQRQILAVIFDRESINRILVRIDQPTELPAHKPARGPPTPSPVKTGARTRPSPAAEEDDSQLFIDPDNSEWDCIDEPFETDDIVAAAAHQDAPRTAPADEQKTPNSCWRR